MDNVLSMLQILVSSYWEIPHWEVAWETDSEQFEKTDLSDFYLFSQQKGGRFDEKMIQKEVADKRVLNSKSLLYFLLNPHLIPGQYKNRRIFFWGTIYRKDKAFYVLQLWWSAELEQWCCSYHNLNQYIHCTVPLKE